MRYLKSVLLYEDKVSYGFLLKLIIVVMPVAFLVTSLILWLAEETEGSLILLIEAFAVGLIFWFVFPRKYQVYEDHLRIVLGGPFSIQIGFEQITTIEATNRFALSINFITRIAKKYILIRRKRGMSIAITPQDHDSFVNNANQAIAQWTRTRSE